MGAIAGLAQWGAVVLGFIAAALWFWATVIKVRTRDDPTTERWIDVDEKTGFETDIYATAKAQTYWNRWAAGATAISMLCQALATAIAQH